MASVVLTVVGGAIGGPIGASIGGAVGGIFDREVLFKPKGREGPRLNELRVQSSSYGTQIPKLFGTMRVAGSVIWATDLVEHRSSQGGKGRATTTTYSYTASFAVALSARPVLGVGRIWADGKLLRGAAGDFKAKTGFRLHLGGEDQAADPLIVAAEGAALAPAHRGIAYAVFEDLELGDFGNRIPSLTFEVIADAGPCDAGAILATLADGDLAAEGGGVPLGGFSAYGASVRAVAETLAGAAGGWFRSGVGGLTLCRGDGPAVPLTDPGAGARRKGARGVRAIASADATAKAVTLTYYDPARDYQAGVQRAVRPGAGTRETRLELPAAIDAGAAKTMAEATLARLEAERERRTLYLPWHALALAPGARVTIADAGGIWRVDRWTLEDMVLALECVAVAPGAPPATASDGRVSPAPDRVAGATRIEAFEMPLLDDVLASVPRLAIAAAGEGAGWRSAALLLSVDGGASWAPAGSTAAPGVLGRIVEAPGAGPVAFEDRVNTLVVELAHPAMVLGDADAAAMQAGANLAMVGDELLQFARAVPLGGARWRLTGLWRGRRGTEAAIGTQRPGDRFVCIARDALTVLDLPTGLAGGTAGLIAQGIGDAGSGVSVTAAITGASLVPPAPVHLRAAVGQDGALHLSWVRRSRNGWHWADGIDAPLGEEAERYRIELLAGGEVIRSAESTQAAWVAEAALWAGATHARIRQIGALGLSLPGVIQL
ncbi:phage tail protein [Sphingomonas sp. CJ20]